MSHETDDVQQTAWAHDLQAVWALENARTWARNSKDDALILGMESADSSWFYTAAAYRDCERRLSGALLRLGKELSDLAPPGSKDPTGPEKAA